MLKLLSHILITVFMLGSILLDSAPSPAAPALVARGSDVAGVYVVVTPATVGQGVALWEFQIVMDTHTKPLNEDLARAAVQIDDAGHRSAPVSWKGDPPGSHHRKGVLQFAAPAGTPAAIELQIDGVGGPGTRTFRWQLK